MNRLLRYFFQGLLVILPVVLTIYLLYLVLVKLNGFFFWIGKKLASEETAWITSLLGFVTTVGFVVIAGIFASNFIGKAMVKLVEGMFQRLPLVKLLYGSIKDLLSAFVGDRKSFDRPVLVSLTGSGDAKVIGFVTRDSLDFLGIDDHVAVYLPQSYNFAGNLLMFPKDRLIPIDAASSDVMTFLVSGGVSGQDDDD